MAKISLKRIITLFTAIIMLISLLPLPVLAKPAEGATADESAVTIDGWTFSSNKLTTVKKSSLKGKTVIIGSKPVQSLKSSLTDSDAIFLTADTPTQSAYRTLAKSSSTNILKKAQAVILIAPIYTFNNMPTGHGHDLYTANAMVSANTFKAQASTFAQLATDITEPLKKAGITTIIASPPKSGSFNSSDTTDYACTYGSQVKTVLKTKYNTKYEVYYNGMGASDGTSYMNGILENLANVEKGVSNKTKSTETTNTKNIIVFGDTQSNRNTVIGGFGDSKQEYIASSGTSLDDQWNSFKETKKSNKNIKTKNSVIVIFYTYANLPDVKTMISFAKKRSKDKWTVYISEIPHTDDKDKNSKIESKNKKINQNSGKNYTAIKLGDIKESDLNGVGVKIIQSIGDTVLTGDDGEGVQTVSDEELMKVFGIDEATLSKIKGWVKVLEADGFSKACIAGILGNARQETGTLDPSRYNPSSDKGGLFGFHNLKAVVGASETMKKCKHEKNAAGVCTDGVCQVIYFCIENKNMSNASRWAKLAEYQPYVEAHKNDGFSDTINNKKYDFSGLASIPSDITGLESYKKISNPADASVIFQAIAEGNAASQCWWDNHDPTEAYGGGTQIGKGQYGSYLVYEYNAESGPRQVFANTFFGWLGGESASKGVDSESTQELVDALVDRGYWTEEQLSQYSYLLEPYIDIDSITRDNLAQDEVSGLAAWEDNVELYEEQHGIFHWIRVVISGVGILLTVYAVLLYLAFWVDRTIPILEISLVGLLTGHALEAAMSDEDSTYQMTRRNATGNVKLVKHKDIVIICLILFLFGVLLISGLLYRVLLIGSQFIVDKLRI